MTTIDERFRMYKPEGPDYHYVFCLMCDKEDDGTMLLNEFGLCRECCQKILDIAPDGLYAHIGRLFLYASKKQLILGNAPKKDINKLEGRKHDRNIP